MFGMDTYYRYENGKPYCKVRPHTHTQTDQHTRQHALARVVAEARLAVVVVQVQGKFKDTNIFDQLAVIREADLYNKWGPFVSKSTLIK